MGVEVMVKKYRVQLAEEEQGELKAMVSKGERQPISRLMPASPVFTRAGSAAQ